MRLLIILALIVFYVSSLHWDNNNHQLTPKQQIHSLNINQHQQSTDNTSLSKIQLYMTLIDNQMKQLESTCHQVQSLPDSQVIGPEGNVISCKNVPKRKYENFMAACQNIGTDIWEVYYLIQQYEKVNGENSDLQGNYSSLKQRHLKLLKTQVRFCPENTNDQKINEPKQLKQSNSFIDTTNHKYYSYLASDGNWAYGKLSEQDFLVNQYQFLLSNEVMQCPGENPFASNENCIVCSGNQIFFLDTLKCGKCPNNTVFKNQSHLCEGTQQKKCPFNKEFSDQSQKCECPSQLPYFDGQQCVSCYLPNYWNTKSKKCQTCLKGQYYSVKQESCLACPNEQKYISSLSSCHDQCSLTKPFFNGQSCISCSETFNKDIGRCQSCPKGLFFNKDTGLCGSDPITEKIRVKCSEGFSFNSINGQCVKQVECECPQTYVYNKDRQKCQCPSNIPYDTGLKCVNCQYPNVWNSDNKICVSCSSQQYYDRLTGVCAKCPKQNPYLNNGQCGPCPTRMIYSEEKGLCVVNQKFCPDTYVWSDEKAMCICPQEKPLQTQQGCKASCTEGQIWSENQKSCIDSGIDAVPIAQVDKLHKCKQAQIWNQAQKKCICISGKPYQTNQGCTSCYPPMIWSQPQGKCIYSNQTKKPQTVTSCKSNFVFDVITKQCNCPKQTPFNNGQVCQSCYLPMYWSHLERSCKYCPQNQYFNPLKRVCQNCPNIKPILINYVCQQCPSGTTFNLLSLKCQNIQCSGDSVYSVVKNECSCKLKEKPFYNGKKCVECKAPNRWDITSRTCVYGNYSPSNLKTTTTILNSSTLIE